MKNWKETCLEDACGSIFWHIIMSTPAFGEQQLQLWLCGTGALALRTYLRGGQWCRILPLEDSPASLLMLGTRTRLSFVGRDEAGAGSSTTEVCNENCRAEVVAPSGGKHHAELSLCRAGVFAAAKVLEGLLLLESNAMWLWTCPS